MYKACWVAVALILAQTTMIWASDESEQSCSVLASMSANDAASLEIALAELTARWPAENREAVKSSLVDLMDQVTFVGGNAYELVRLGSDLALHLIVLRLQDGETAALSVTYEWTQDGMRATQLDFKTDYVEDISVAALANAEAVACP